MIVNKGTKDEFDAGMYATGVKLKKGDKIFYGSSGGGGFGDPLDREWELVLDDVIDEWLTIEAAEKYYGVVIEEIDAEAADYRINEEKTKKAQAKLRKKGFKEGTGAFEINVLGKDIKPERIPSEEEVRSHLAISRPPGW